MLRGCVVVTVVMRRLLMETTCERNTREVAGACMEDDPCPMDRHRSMNFLASAREVQREGV